MGRGISFPPSLEKAFQSAGWLPGRRDEQTVANLKRHGISAGHPAFEILRGLGALSVGACGPGEQCSTSNIDFELLADNDPNARQWSKLLGSRLVGIAYIDNRHGELYIAEDGRVFSNSAVHDAFAFLGTTFDEALARLLEGRRAAPMLRPDQAEVSLYGDTFAAGDEALYRWKSE